MWNTKAEHLSERDKYRLLWSTENYRVHSPAEEAVHKIMDRLKPDSLVIDFGCGTGRASLELSKRGVPVLLIDFADNCRDHEAITLPFLEWDLTKPILQLHARFGICFDVMEHIPTADVDGVIRNIMGAAGKVYFQIATAPDTCGALIGATLHNTVQPHEWWRGKFDELGYLVEFNEAGPVDSTFIVVNPHH
jgi:SAM-dependent methyltransferase